jgi:hypothetical protein
MRMSKSTKLLLVANIISLLSIVKSQTTNGLCTVFEPFEVKPEKSRFQIGGPFGLHEEDCIFVKDAPVQELVAAQWALTHWNQHPKNEKVKLG